MNPPQWSPWALGTVFNTPATSKMIPVGAAKPLPNKVRWANPPSTAHFTGGPTVDQARQARVAAVLDTLSVAEVQGGRTYEPTTDHLNRASTMLKSGRHTNLLSSSSV